MSGLAARSSSIGRPFRVAVFESVSPFLIVYTLGVGAGGRVGATDDTTAPEGPGGAGGTYAARPPERPGDAVAPGEPVPPPRLRKPGSRKRARARSPITTAFAT